MPLTPPAMDRIVKVCLAKDPDERWQTAHDLALQFEWVAEGGSLAGVAAPVASRRRRRERLAWALLAVSILFLTSEGHLMAVDVKVSGSILDTAAPKMLFETRVTTATPGSDKYAVSADGRRFLFLTPLQEGRPTPITVVLNWTAALK